MSPRPTLSASMTLSQFDNGYWYAIELKAFASKLGIPSASKLRKDEIETAIKLFLRTGRIAGPARTLSTPGLKDVERGLHLDLRVVVYTNDRETKSFLEREARKLVPGLKRKSGARYRLNRWREQQLTSGRNLTYRDVVAEYARLNSGDEPFAKIPQVRYVNFLAEFLAAEKGATHAQARQAWKNVKSLNAPKTYQSWVKSQK